MRKSFGQRATLIFCIAVVGLFLTANASYTDLVGAWALDEGKGTEIKDSSGNNNNGVATDPEWVDGKRGKALLFSEKNESLVEIPDEDGAFTLQEFTLAAWIKASDLHGGWPAIVGKWDANNRRNYGLWLHNTKGTLYGPQGFGNPKVNVDGGGPDLSDNNWHHVAGTYDGQKAIGYVDGVNVGETDTASVLDEVPDPVRIGKFTQAPHYFAGVIDEVAIYDNALSEDEIADIMDKGFAAVQPLGKLTTTWGVIKGAY